MSERNRQNDLYKLGQAFFANLRRDNCEYGAIGVDCKRPFGNSNVEGDILDIIGLEGDDSDQREYAASLYDELPSYLRERYLEKV